MTVRTSCHPLKLFSIFDSTPLALKAAIVCATLASAVGETKLAFAAIVGGEWSAPCVSRGVREVRRGKGPERRQLKMGRKKIRKGD